MVPRTKIVLYSTILALCMVVWGCRNTTQDPQVETLLLLQPVAGQVFHARDTLRISWEYRNCADKFFPTVICLSVDNGKTFKELFDRFFVSQTPAADTFWVVPDSAALFTEEARVEVYHYSKITLTAVSGSFAIRKR